MILKIAPTVIRGPWDSGFVLDKHTISSTMIGYNEFGHPEFDTVRSELGEAVYRHKYKGDAGALQSIAETLADFVKQKAIRPDLVVPMPPSKQRVTQPLFQIAEEVGKLLGIPAETKCLVKMKSTPQMKDIGDYSERVAALKDAFKVAPELAGKSVLLLDDLYQSGASMKVAAEAIKYAGAKALYTIALTRTRY